MSKCLNQSKLLAQLCSTQRGELHLHSRRSPPAPRTLSSALPPHISAPHLTAPSLPHAGPAWLCPACLSQLMPTVRSVFCPQGYTQSQRLSQSGLEAVFRLHHRLCVFTYPLRVHCKLLYALYFTVLIAQAVLTGSISLFYLALCIYQACWLWKELRKPVSMAGFYSPSAWLKNIFFS